MLVLVEVLVDVLVLVVVVVVDVDVEVLVLVEVLVDVLVLVVVVVVEVVVVVVLVLVELLVEVVVLVVVIAFAYHAVPLYFFHSFVEESKYSSPSTGAEGSALATLILPTKLPYVVISKLSTFFFESASPKTLSGLHSHTSLT